MPLDFSDVPTGKTIIGDRAKTCARLLKLDPMDYDFIRARIWDSSLKVSIEHVLYEHVVTKAFRSISLAKLNHLLVKENEDEA